MKRKNGRGGKGGDDKKSKSEEVKRKGTEEGDSDGNRGEDRESAHSGSGAISTIVVCSAVSSDLDQFETFAFRRPMHNSEN